MKYYVINKWNEECYGPFNTRERATAYIKKYHLWAYVIERTE